jgi:hypothetical protein
MAPYNLSDIPGTEDLNEPRKTTGIKEGTRLGFRRTAMDNTYRLRFLIYLAAFMLVMSLCFVYAEPVTTHSSAPHLLLQTFPQHAGFLPSSSAQPSFDPDALRATLPPTISPAVMEQLELAAPRRHGLLHRSPHAPAYVAPVSPAAESSALGWSTPAAPSAVSGR